MPLGHKDYLDLGNWNARCDGCGFKYKATELRQDWKGLMKCTGSNGCWEPRHPMDLQKPPRASTPVPWTRQDKDINADGTPVLSTDVTINSAVENTGVNVPQSTFNIADPIGS